MMRMTVKAVLAVTAAGAFTGDAWAQSQGPLTTVPWATRARPKPNPEQQNMQQNTQQPRETDAQLLTAPPSGQPVQATPEPARAKN